MALEDRELFPGEVKKLRWNELVLTQLASALRWWSPVSWRTRWTAPGLVVVLMLLDLTLWTMAAWMFSLLASKAVIVKNWHRKAKLYRAGSGRDRVRERER